MEDSYQKRFYSFSYYYSKRNYLSLKERDILSKEEIDLYDKEFSD